MNKKSIVYLGYSSFPVGLAETQKIILISKSLILTGNIVTVICRNGTHDKLRRPELLKNGIIDNIKYIYASGSCFRNENFFKRRIFEIKGKINEFILLWKMNRRNDLDYAILSTRKFSSVLYYVLLSKIFRFKTILNYVEYYSALKKNKSQVRQYWNDKFFDNHAPQIVACVFPISEFLIGHLSKVASKKKYFKIPVLTDFDKYHHIDVLPIEPYFLFCGDASYKEIIFFIIDCYIALERKCDYSLYLIISGKEEDINQIKQYSEEHFNLKTIKLFSSVPEKELYSLYKNAKALLIPLRPTLQDFARFPHKTGEYLASGNPVISTNYAEMKFYFKDGEDMLLADSYDKNLFKEKMQFIVDHPEEALSIGLRGKNKALELFDYRKIAQALNNFLDMQC